MRWTWYLFRFDGRINRALLWQALLIVALLAALLEVTGQAIAAIEGATSLKIRFDIDFDFGLDDLFGVIDPRAWRWLPSANRPILILRVFGTALFCWIFLATAIKRLHDRDRSGWWIVAFVFVPRLLFRFSDWLPDAGWFVPFDCAIYALWLWGLAELFCLRGTAGSNRFGPDPVRDAPGETRAAHTPAWDQQSELEIVPHRAPPPRAMG
jgi:uncharacterized membrane protein YhaH (DUF805 family)